MNKLYKVRLPPQKVKNPDGGDKWVITYWTLNVRIVIFSFLEFREDDIVEIVSISDNEVQVAPRYQITKEEEQEALNLLVVCPTIPFSSDCDYSFKAPTGEILKVVRAEYEGNANYIILVATPQNVPATKVSGVDAVTKTEVEFLVYEVT